MNIRPIVRTRFSTDDYAAALRAADPTLSREAAGVLWAQYALETGRGDSCFGFNLGNVKVTRLQAEAGVPFFMLPNTWEIEHGRRVVYQPPHEQTWFRAFDSLADAMTHHLGFLARRYGTAWQYARSGDPTAFALALKRGGYYTGSEVVYAGSLRHLQAEFLREAEWPEPEAVDPNEVTITGPAHGTSVVDWALEQREADRKAKLDADLCALGMVDFLGMSRREEAA